MNDRTVDLTGEGPAYEPKPRGRREVEPIDLTKEEAIREESAVKS